MVKETTQLEDEADDKAAAEAKNFTPLEPIVIEPAYNLVEKSPEASPITTLQLKNLDS